VGRIFSWSVQASRQATKKHTRRSLKGMHLDRLRLSGLVVAHRRIDM
jgi:hypothetical protein